MTAAAQHLGLVKQQFDFRLVARANLQPGVTNQQVAGKRLGLRSPGAELSAAFQPHAPATVNLFDQSQVKINGHQAQWIALSVQQSR